MKPKGEFKGFHHFYLGLILAILGWLIAWFSSYSIGATLCILGVLIMLDDALQHFLHLDTPCAKLNRKLHRDYYQYRFIVKVLDWIFGKRY